MVGVVVDAQRMHRTKKDWSELIASLSERAGRQIAEMRTRDFYKGNSPRRAMEGHERAAVVGDVCKWLSPRKHRLVFTGVDMAAYSAARASTSIPSELNTP